MSLDCAVRAGLGLAAGPSTIIGGFTIVGIATVFAVGAAVLTFAAAVFAVGATVIALGAHVLAFGAPVFALGAGLAAPRCAMHTPVSKPSSMPPTISFLKVPVDMATTSLNLKTAVDLEA
jgi:hypothetical protein